MKGIIKFFLFSILYLIVGSLSAQSDCDSIHFAQADDKLSYLQVGLETDNLDVYTQDKDYDYQRKPVADKNFIQRWLESLRKKLSKTFDVSIDFANTIIYLVAISIFVILIILYARHIGLTNQLAKRDRYVDNLDLDIIDINTSETSINQFLEQAIQDQDYRLATRFWFIKAIKVMNDKGIVSHHSTKTIQEYLYEIKDDSIKTEFTFLASIYQYIWYGENTPELDSFQDYQQRFKQFDASLSNLKEKV